MIINKPQFWDKKKFTCYFTFSLRLLLKQLSTLKKIFSPIKFNIPVICVGNIYIGGTGKTPSTLFIAKALKNFGKDL